MAVAIVFETHSWSEDNESGNATGWNHGRLSPKGRVLAAELGERRRDDGIDCVYTSDLRRAVETTQIAFPDDEIPVLADWRLRECNYGSLNGMPAKDLHRRRDDYLTEPYPGEESWMEALERVGWCLQDLLRRHDGGRVLIVGHVATRWGIQSKLEGIPLSELASTDFDWQLGWEYEAAAHHFADAHFAQ